MEAVATPEAAKKTSTFDFNYQELMNLDIERPAEIIEGLICERQNVLLMGRFGVGKTMLGAQMSLSLATGKDFVGRKVKQPCRVAIIDCENDLGDLKERLKKQHDAMELTKDEDAILGQNWRCASAGDPDSELYGMQLDKGKHEPLANYVHKHSPDVLIVDNLGLVVSRGDLKEAEEAKEFYSSLAKVRAASPDLQNGAIIVMHHLTKPGESLQTEQASLLTAPAVFLSRARGTGRVLDFAQARLAINEERVGNKIYFVVNGVNRSTKPTPLILQFNQETLSFEKHEDQDLRFNSVFASRPKGKEIYVAFPDVFTWTEAEKLVDPRNGKPYNKDTVNNTRRLALTEGFIVVDPQTKRYTKLYHPK